MNQNKEIEFKVLTSKEKFNNLLALYPNHTLITQRNHYYSSANNLHFRIRQINDSYLFTFKEKIDENSRMEHEKVLSSLNFLDDQEILSMFNRYNILPPYLYEGELTTTRYVVNIHNQAELCFDINHYNNIVDYEIEFEITNHAELNDFISILSQAGIEYIPNHYSKTARCISTKTTTI